MTLWMCPLRASAFFLASNFSASFLSFSSRMLISFLSFLLMSSRISSTFFYNFLKFSWCSFMVSWDSFDSRDDIYNYYLNYKITKTYNQSRFALLELPVPHPIGRVAHPQRNVKWSVLQLVYHLHVLLVVQSHHLTRLTLNHTKSTALPVLPALCR